MWLWGAGVHCPLPVLLFCQWCALSRQRRPQCHFSAPPFSARASWFLQKSKNQKLSAMAGGHPDTPPAQADTCTATSAPTSARNPSSAGGREPPWHSYAMQCALGTSCSTVFGIAMNSIHVYRLPIQAQSVRALVRSASLVYRTRSRISPPPPRVAPRGLQLARMHLLHSSEISLGAVLALSFALPRTRCAPSARFFHTLSLL